MRIESSFRVPDLWVNHRSVTVHGRAFQGDTLLTSDTLARSVARTASTEELSEVLNELNGSFALIHETEEDLRLAVDHVRSVPLFYGISGGTTYVSDDCHWVEDRVAPGAREEVTRIEFLHSGYVAGADTRNPSVSQCRPGELLSIERKAIDPKICSHRYFVYGHREPVLRDSAEMTQLHLQAINSACRRLIRIADGRQIVLPLSGGKDSRLLAVALRAAGYERLCTFSYGRSGNYEGVVSQQVAKDLGLSWHFVEYSEEQWSRIRDSADWSDYFRYAGTLASLPHVQDFIAVKTLLARGVIERDCLLAPGHSLDLLAGSRSKGKAAAVYRQGHRDDDVVVDALLRWHFALWPETYRSPEVQATITKRIRKLLSETNAQGPLPNASLFETWDWETRQAKFIVNSVRVYEFFGLDWWLPLWDREICDFWSRALASMRLDKEWYDTFVDNWFVDATCAAPPRAPQGVMGTARYLMRWIPGLKSVLKRLGVKRLVRQPRHPLAWLGVATPAQRPLISEGSQNINTYLAEQVLDSEADEGRTIGRLSHATSWSGCCMRSS